jgi:uncharacterized surface protein with fasciclin (FAS1) repeats
MDTRTVAVETRNIIEKAESLGTIKTFIKAVRKAGLEALLRGDGPFTVFAPTDSAFYRMPPQAVRDLLNDPAAVRSFVRHHILPNRKLRSSDVAGMEAVPTLAGGSLTFNTGPAYHFVVNDAPVVMPDIACSNGIIHIVDALLARG